MVTLEQIANIKEMAEQYSSDVFCRLARKPTVMPGSPVACRIGYYGNRGTGATNTAASYSKPFFPEPQSDSFGSNQH
jgi:hypothetical protein